MKWNRYKGDKAVKRAKHDAERQRFDYDRKIRESDMRDYVAGGTEKEKELQEELSRKLDALQAQFTGPDSLQLYSDSRTGWLDMKANGKTDAQRQYNDAFQRQQVLLCLDPLTNGLTPTNVLSTLGMYVGFAAINKNIRTLMSDTLANGFKSAMTARMSSGKFSEMNPIDKFCKNEYERFAKAANDGKLPYTGQTAALMSVAIDKEAYVAMRRTPTSENGYYEKYLRKGDKMFAEMSDAEAHEARIAIRRWDSLDSDGKFKDYVARVDAARANAQSVLERDMMLDGVSRESLEANKNLVIGHLFRGESSMSTEEMAEARKEGHVFMTDLYKELRTKEAVITPSDVVYRMRFDADGNPYKEAMTFWDGTFSRVDEFGDLDGKIDTLSVAKPYMADDFVSEVALLHNNTAFAFEDMGMDRQEANNFAVAIQFGAMNRDVTADYSFDEEEVVKQLKARGMSEGLTCTDDELMEMVRDKFDEFGDFIAKAREDNMSEGKIEKRYWLGASSALSDKVTKMFVEKYGPKEGIALSNYALAFSKQMWFTDLSPEYSFGEIHDSGKIGSEAYGFDDVFTKGCDKLADEYIVYALEKPGFSGLSYEDIVERREDLKGAICDYSILMAGARQYDNDRGEIEKAFEKAQYGAMESTVRMYLDPKSEKEVDDTVNAMRDFYLRVASESESYCAPYIYNNYGEKGFERKHRRDVEIDFDEAFKDYDDYEY